MFRFIVFLALLSSAFSQNQNQQVSKPFTLQVSPQQQGACGPPTYSCSRTDMATVQTPNPPPSVGNLLGIGTVVVDPDFKNPICRVTDASWGNNTFNAAGSGSGDENHWSLDRSLLTVSDSGGNTIPVSIFFDGKTCTVSKLYMGSLKYPKGFTVFGTAEYSRRDSNTLYNFVTKGGATRIESYSFLDRINPPTPQITVDFQSALVVASGVNPFVSTWATNGSIVDQDAVFGMGFSNNGFQGGVGALYAASYVAGKGFSVLNTKTGAVTGTFGSVGTIPNWNTITNGAGFTLHNAKMNKDGDEMIITATDSSCNFCGVYFWQVGTLNIGRQTARPGGHWTSGRKYFANGTDVSVLATRLFSTPDVVTVLDPKCTGAIPKQDSHFSWNNLSPNDTNPIIDSTSWVLNPPPLWPGCGFNEIRGFETVPPALPGKGKMWRFAHTMNSGKSIRFSTSNAIGSGSQDGWAYSFSSDWMGMLGSESGQSTCTLGVDCRGDVFVVLLQ